MKGLGFLRFSTVNLLFVREEVLFSFFNQFGVISLPQIATLSAVFIHFCNSVISVISVDEGF